MPIYSYNRYTADGGTTSFSITFGYLATSHIKVYVNDVEQTSGFTVSEAENKVNFTTAPAANDIVLLKRVTPKTKADFQSEIADFSAGSVLTEADLDNATIGLLYVSQELTDFGETNGLGLDQVDENWTAESKRIKSVAAPTDGTDAVNKDYIDEIALFGASTVPQAWEITSWTADSSDYYAVLADAASVSDVMYFVETGGVIQKPTDDYTVTQVGNDIRLTMKGFSTSPGTTRVRNLGVARSSLETPLRADSAASVGFAVKGFDETQSADLFQAQNSSGSAMFQVSPSGAVTTGSTINATGTITAAEATTSGHLVTKGQTDILMPIGGIIMWPYISGLAVPTDYLLCDGSTFSSTTYPDLYTILGSTTLPNLVDKMPRGHNSTYNGAHASGGADTVTLVSNNLPQHNHGAGTYATAAHYHHMFANEVVNSQTGAQTTNSVVNDSLMSGTRFVRHANRMNTSDYAMSNQSTTTTASVGRTSNATSTNITGSSGNAGQSSPTAVTITNPYTTLWFIIRAK